MDNDKKIKPAAIQALGGAVSSPEIAVQVLEEVLKDADPSVRNQAIQSLGRLGPVAVPALLSEFNDSYTILASVAEQAILKMGPSAVPALEKAKSVSDEALQKRISALIAPLH